MSSRIILAGVVAVTLAACSRPAPQRTEPVAAISQPSEATVRTESRRPALSPEALALENIYAKVATDAVAQYRLAKKSDDKIQVCVQAGLVSAAYLQAQDEPNYLAAKATEKAECAAAGIPK